MKTIIHQLDPETYVCCEKAALAAGKKSVGEWLDFLLSKKVGHTSFAREGRAYPTATRRAVSKRAARPLPRKSI